jgi:hypothetical protein
VAGLGKGGTVSLREGGEASWVGWEAALEIGDRCRIMKLERTHAHVKWLTGAKRDSFEMHTLADLVADLPPARDMDAFTFEAHSGRMISIACREIAERRGDAGLYRTLDQQGVFADLDYRAQSLVAELRSDPTIREVQEDLGDLWPRFERYALQQIVLAKLGEVEEECSVEGLAPQ